MKLKYDLFNRAEPSKIYLAKPGKRIIAALPGVIEDQTHVDINFNNTSVLETVIDRDISGEVNPYYELVQRHYELYVTNVGWFKINEEPTLENDGYKETKTVHAESLEIELQQYDLVEFIINTGAENSKEMLATDNTYLIDDFTMFRENVKFYRDTTDLSQLSADFKASGGSSIADLRDMLYTHPGILTSWRVDFNYETFDNAIRSTIAEYEQEGKSTSVISQYIGKIKDKGAAVTLTKVFPEILKYADIIVDQKDAIDETITYTAQEVIDRELARQNELSFLYLVLHEHGWTVGYVDPTIKPGSDNPADLEKLADRIGTFEVDTQDIYSFLTQEAAQYYRCIFVFDSDNYKVSAYKVETIGKDTNICINFHSIENSVTRSSDRELHTVYHVAGADDLDVTEANFGSNAVEDLSYFMNTDHFKQETIDKYNNWYTYREGKRPEYVQLSKDYRNQLIVIDEIYSRVPLDGADTAQYSTFSNEELLEEKARYQAIMRGLETRYVDEDGNFDIDFMRENAPYDYANYILIRDQIIPNIDTEIYNRGVDSVQDQREFLDGYKYDFNTYGGSYGLAELSNQLTTLNNAITTLKKRGYDHPGEEGDEYAAQQYALYQKYTTAYGQCETVYATRKGEYDAAQATLDQIVANMEAMRDDVDKTNEQFGFTTKELWLLDKYYMHTDYVNENLLVTDIMTPDEIVDKELELILDAKEELYTDAHPQYTFETTQDNLLIIPEFTGWHDDLEVGNFIRIGLRENYQVKLRITTIGFNPFLTETDISLTFSNMVQYRAKRNDFVDLLGSAGGSSKNQISSRIGTTVNDSDINISSNLIMRIINNGTFQSYQNSVIGESTAASISAVSGSIASLVAEQIDAVTINVEQITGTKAQFEQVFADYIESNYLVTRMLRADQAKFGELSAQVITVGTDGITRIANDAITTATLSADQIIAGIASTDDPTKFNILAGSAFVDYLESNLVVASEIDVNQLRAKMATIDLLDAGQISADSAFIQSLQSISSSAASSTINDAYIRNAVVGKISVGDLAAGNIVLSDSMRITSENGAMVMNGQALQIMGEDEDGKPYVGIQLGYDTSSNPSLILRNSDGATVLTPQGITQDAVADGLIINNMVADGTLTKQKLGFQVIEPNAQGGIDITQVYDGSGNQWGLEYTSFKDDTTSALREIESKKMYRVEVQSDNGNLFRSGSVNCTLSCRVYSWDDDITDDVNASNFKWTRKSKDTAGDTRWNNNHSGGVKSVTLTPADVFGRSVFYCTVTLPDGSVETAG